MTNSNAVSNRIAEINNLFSTAFGARETPESFTSSDEVRAAATDLGYDNADELADAWEQYQDLK